MATSVSTMHEIDVQDGEYLRHGTTPLLARVYQPRGTGPFPLVVDLHGGAWCRGDRLNDAAINEALARSGVVVAALDFRMPPVAPYPASVADIHYGIRWLKTMLGRSRFRRLVGVSDEQPAGGSLAQSATGRRLELRACGDRAIGEKS